METFAVGNRLNSKSILCVKAEKKKKQLWVITKGCSMFLVEKQGEMRIF